MLTADAVIAGIHFFPEDAADMVAKKALRVNLSDLAAKGAKPVGFLLTLALPKSLPESWVELFARGLGSDAEQYGCPLLGGDFVRTTGPIAISITAIGSVPTNTMVRRSGARVGDAVMVTGTIGDAALGLELRDAVTAAKRWKLENKHSYQLMRRYLLPQPRNALAEAVRLNASAAMDVSDGLAGDLGKLCDVSGVSAEIEVARVPLSEAAASVVASEPAAIQKVLTGGDDYEIVCTVAPGAARRVPRRRRHRARARGRDRAYRRGEGAAAVPGSRRQADRIQADVLQSFLTDERGEFDGRQDSGNDRDRFGCAAGCLSGRRQAAHALPHHRLSAPSRQPPHSRALPSNTATAAPAPTPASGATGRDSTRSNWFPATA